jgi:hypothetical protein
MCDTRSQVFSDSEPAQLGASSSSSRSSHSSAWQRSPAGSSPPSVSGPAFEAGHSDMKAMTLATAERLYRCLAIGREARPGDLLLRAHQVSDRTLRRWRRRGWIVMRDRAVLTKEGCQALTTRAAVVELAARAGRSTLFL